MQALEFKDRVRLISRRLEEFLPRSYPDALEVLTRILGPVTKDKEEFMYGFRLMPVAHFVETNGLAHFDESIAALYEITKRHTVEFAIRPFLLEQEKRTLSVLRKWATDSSEDVRRLVSESTRPRLPWASRLSPFIDDPTPVIELLGLLKDDDSLYVRRSVDNNLNDISKDHPQVVLNTLKRWQSEGGDHVDWIIRHALRGLVKEGDPGALALIGVHKPLVTLTRLRLKPRRVEFDNYISVKFEVESRSRKPQRLVIDYIVHFVKSNGKRSPKVFKLITRKLNAGEKVDIERRHTFKPITTRKHYSGKHRFEIQVNGVIMAGADFELVM